ncbi:MAG TPA: FmdB family zinc ribbon protein [Acidobacteriota bacterium]|nr:FmdB family zinc ribbon protein [Acidobacteriota bacterium]
MPLYEYQCRKCQKVFEIIQKFSDEELSECEDCGGELERLLSAPAIQFKGSGWYITDYARKGTNSGDGATPSKSTTEKSDTSTSSSTSESRVASGKK